MYWRLQFPRVFYSGFFITKIKSREVNLSIINDSSFISLNIRAKPIQRPPTLGILFWFVEKTKSIPILKKIINQEFNFWFLDFISSEMLYLEDYLESKNKLFLGFFKSFILQKIVLNFSDWTSPSWIAWPFLRNKGNGSGSSK